MTCHNSLSAEDRHDWDEAIATCQQHKHDSTSELVPVHADTLLAVDREWIELSERVMEQGARTGLFVFVAMILATMIGFGLGYGKASQDFAQMIERHR